MNLENTDEFKREIQELFNLIETTPVGSKKEVQEHHGKIIERLDSERIIEVPSLHHRNLHQMMWMKGHAIYENMLEDMACMDFVTSPHRERFDIWYVTKYIFGKKLSNWERKMCEEASRECLSRYKHPIEEILESEVLE